MSDSWTGLQSLDIVDFRNIESAELLFSSGLNLVTGPNAAGKTSLLEAIYCLGRVRSFRTSDSNQLIRDHRSGYRLVGRVGVAQGRSIPIGMERSRGKHRVHLEGQPVHRLSDLAGRFPVQIMTGDTSNIIHGGPRYRRQSLDWALFHVEHGYRNAWQRYARALRQRNAAIRQRMPGPQVTAWDAEIIDTGEEIDKLRREYLNELEQHLVEELDQLLPGHRLNLHYQSGWAGEVDLAMALRRSLERDCVQGYTGCGPHRADFRVAVNGKSVLSHYSRGQQKTILVAYLLAQVNLQHTKQQPAGVFLLDDLASELDANHQTRILSCLAALQSQVFVTAIDSHALDTSAWPSHKRFHVEHGRVMEVVY